MHYAYKTSEYECVAPEDSEVAPYDPYDPCDLPEYCTGSSAACTIVKDNRCGVMLPYERSLCGRSMHCPIHVQASGKDRCADVCVHMHSERVRKACHAKECKPEWP